MNIWAQIFFFAVCIALGKYQAYRFDTQQLRIDHKTWASAYFLAAAQVYWFGHNWWLVGACMLQHLPVFNTALNFSRKAQRPFWIQLFYTHPEDPQGSWQDRLWGRWYWLVFFLSIAALVVIQFFIFKSS